MRNPIRGIWQFTSGPNRKFLGTFILLLLIAGIPLTVFVAQQQQDLRQRASEQCPAPSVPVRAVREDVVRVAETGTEYDQVTFSWSAVSGADYYTLSYALNEKITTNEWTGIPQANTTISFRFNSNYVRVLPTDKIALRVIAVKSCASEQASSEPLIMVAPGQQEPPPPPGCLPPVAPTLSVNRTSGLNGTDNFALTWNAVPIVSYYNVEYKKSEGARFESVNGNISTTSTNVGSGANIASTLVGYFKVRAVNSCGAGEFSTVVTSNPLNTPAAVKVSVPVRVTVVNPIPQTTVRIIAKQNFQPGLSINCKDIPSPLTSGTVTGTCEGLDPNKSYSLSARIVSPTNANPGHGNSEGVTITTPLTQPTPVPNSVALTVTLPALAARPSLCQSTTISGTTLTPDQAITMTSTANTRDIKTFSYMFYNLDNLNTNGNPKPIQFVANTDYVKKVDVTPGTTPTNSISIAFADLNKLDLNNGSKYPKRIQVNAYFTHGDGRLSLPEVPCVKSFTIVAPSTPATYTLSGTVFVDTNKNGTKDTGEVGYANAAVQVKYQFKAGSWNATTNTSGVYTISGREQENYVASLTVPTGYVLTTPNSVHVGLGQNSTVNFGIVPIVAPGSFTLSGTAFVDTNKNGTKDTGEVGLTSIPVKIKYQYKAETFNTTTSATGTYSFANREQENYIVSVTTSAGYQLTTPNDVVVNLGQNKTVDFGIAQTQAPAVNGTKFVMVLSLHGLGASGDNVTPNSRGTLAPTRLGRTVTVEVFDASGKLVLTKTGPVIYKPVPPGTTQGGTQVLTGTQGKFTGTVDMGTTLATGNYTLKVKPGRYLRRRIPGILHITAGSTVTLPEITFVTGDVNNDNLLNILDYNTIMDCYKVTTPTARCTDALKHATDLNDDGVIDQFDYNLFLRELSVQTGE